MKSKQLFKTADGADYTITFILITSLFLLWGFCNGMIDVMDKHFQNTLHLTKEQSAWVQFAHYFGYFFIALPAGWIARKLGYKGGIVFGLGMIASGALWFIPATQIGTFWAFLIGLFILAMGLTFLETVANPYTTMLGPGEYSATRINLAQSLNGLGWVFGPIVAGHFIFSKTGEANTSNDTLYIPYLGVAIIVLVLVVVFWFSSIPEIKAEDDYHLDEKSSSQPQSIWKKPHFVLAIVAQFFYVAAQTGIFSFFINYIDTEIPKMSAAIAGHLPGGWTYEKEGGYLVSEYGASQLLSYVGFILFLAGRFSGSMILRWCPAHLALGTYALVNTALMLLVFLHIGWISVFALFGSFFFMSIMFPTIFALGIHGLGNQSKKASSFIVMAIVGGAIMPKFMGWIADISSMTKGFVIPLICFLLVALYGYTWSRLSKSDGIKGVSTVKAA